MKVWVTGCLGFLGSHICEALIADGYEVDGNDNLLCGDVNNAQKMSYTYTDCRNFDAMYAFMKQSKPDVLVHCAATAHEGLSNFSPSFVTRNIYEASVTTFSAAIAAGVKRIVFMSSMARYGVGEPPFTEGERPDPIDPYGIAKVAAENTLKALCRVHGVKYAILVPHNIIGTRQKVDSYRNVATIMINRCLQGKPPYIYGDGEQVRCFSPVKDCIPSILAALHGCADGEVVNIGPDKGEITIKELAEKIMLFTNYTNQAEYLAPRPNEVKHAYCSSDKARKLLNYEPKQSIDDCLKEMIANHAVKPFAYDFPIEIENNCPRVWKDRML